MWFDQSELRGGDAWDQKIRRQIKECALFVPIISAQTQARTEGYFRREWKLAVERSQDMADHVAFLLPVVLGQLRENEAHVPEAFLRVQWTRVNDEAAECAFGARVQALLQGGGAFSTGSMPALRGTPERRSAAAPRSASAARGAHYAWAALALAMTAGGFAVWRGSRPKAETVPATAPAASEQAVAVLPFANLSGDREQEYFSDGLTEEILNAVAREPDLRVVPRTSAFSFKNKPRPLPEIARELNVGRVVEGSVQRSGRRVRILCTVTQVADRRTEALPSIDREVDDIFALQDDVARAVVAKLTGRATTTPVTVGTTNAVAYDWYLRGRSHAAQVSLAWPQAVVAFQEAVKLDSQFALAWADLGRIATSMYAVGIDSAGLAIGERAATEALRLQPDLAEAHLAQVGGLRARFAPMAEVERALADAERLKPNAPEIAASRASLAQARGHYDDAIRWWQRALDRDPRHGGYLNSLGNSLTQVGRYAEADAAFRQAFAILGTSIPQTNRARVAWESKADRALVTRMLDDVSGAIRGDRYWGVRALQLYACGDFPGALAAVEHVPERADFFRVRSLFTAEVREAMGDVAGARADYLKALPIVENMVRDYAAHPTPLVEFALVQAALGRKEEAYATVRRAAEIGRPEGYVGEAAGEIYPGVYKGLARIHARFGANDEALAIVEAQIKSGAWRRTYLLHHLDWAQLRADPRFRALAEKAPL